MTFGVSLGATAGSWRFAFVFGGGKSSSPSLRTSSPSSLSDGGVVGSGAGRFDDSCLEDVEGLVALIVFVSFRWCVGRMVYVLVVLPSDDVLGLNLALYVTGYILGCKW